MDPLSLGMFGLLGLQVLLFLWMCFVCRKEYSVFSLPENTEILDNAKKEVFGFKLAATIFVLLFLVLPAIISCSWLGTVGIIFLCPFILSCITIFAGYNYLYLVEKESSAKIILTIPFVPIFLTLVVGMIYWTFNLLVFFSPQLIGWLLMLYKLPKGRTRFRSLYLESNSDSDKIREQAYFSDL